MKDIALRTEIAREIDRANAEEAASQARKLDREPVPGRPNGLRGRLPAYALGEAPGD